MAWGIAGHLVPISRDTSVADRETQTFDGCVWIADDGTIAAITKRHQRAPPGFESATVADVGDRLVLPGFIDLHSHLAYAALPLWSEPGRDVPFLHHESWPGASTYARRVTWPAYAYVVAAPAELLAYAEVRALAGGTTSIQGSPPSNRPLDGWLARNVEDERLGKSLPADRVLASTLTLKPEELARRAEKMSQCCDFIYHCAEGQRNSIVTREYESLKRAGCLQRGLVMVHASALPPEAFDAWVEPGAIVWSPFSNFWLYGQTTDVPSALARHVRICVGSDWGPSGTRNVLGELKVAALVAEANSWDLPDFELVKMITANPGDVLEAAWRVQVGRLQPRALADVVVLSAGNDSDPFKTVIHATEKDVKLVVVGGRAVFGISELMAKARAPFRSEVRLGTEKRQLSMNHFEDRQAAWAWDEVLQRMEQVRANPKREIERARAEAYARASSEEPLRLRLALDMPSGVVPIGGLPKDLGQVEVPPIPPIAHDAAYFHEVKQAGFHNGLLNGLATFYGVRPT